MKKLFISQPMKGRTNEEILKERERVFSLVKEKIDKDITLIDSFIEEAPSDVNPIWFIGESLKFLAIADIAYFVKGWDSHTGCIIEHYCADKYDINCIICENDDYLFVTTLEEINHSDSLSLQGIDSKPVFTTRTRKIIKK